MPDVIVSAPALAAELLGDRPPRLLDVRWSLGGPPGIGAYRAGHLPGAVFVDLDADLAAPPSPQAGRHPLPDVADLQAAARRWGLRQDEPVVVYDDSGAMSASRAWWLLRWAGVADVRILDGGLPAWAAAGGSVETGQMQPPEGDVVLVAGGMPTIDADQAGDWPAEGLLLDARAGERFRGEVEPVDPRAGHVPGAVSAPTADNLDERGRFRPVDDLTRRFAELGASRGAPVAVYCGSGVTAAHQIAALAAAGYQGVLYPGSWSQWSNDPDRPVATGG